MTEPLWNHVKAIAERAHALPPEERDALISRECAGDAQLEAEVRAQLAALIEQTSFLPTEDDARTISVGDGEDANSSPGLIGRYRIIETLGEGGMGVVYRAEDPEARRTVALKVIKPGMDSKQILARFDAEKNALSLMDHPNIARVYDSGQTPEGRPYFVLEYVAGTPLTEYCARERLPLEERLELFRDICDGVQHAHTKSIVHRDLKPANIIVTRVDGKPVPKIIDFGLAKALGARLTDMTVVSLQRQVMGTLEYMSPEQAGSGGTDVDTRTDVYALGIILYELLVDKRPFDLRDRAQDEVFRIIREEDAPRPSLQLARMPADETTRLAESRGLDTARLRTRLQGELDWIVLKALDKQRDRRYATPLELAADIVRYLGGSEPVLARPPSAIYKLRKFSRKYRGALVSALLVFVTLIGGMTWALIERERARSALKRETQAAAGERKAANEAREERARADDRAAEAAAAATREREARQQAERVRNVAQERLLLSESNTLHETNSPIFKLVLREFPSTPGSRLPLGRIHRWLKGRAEFLESRLLATQNPIATFEWSPDGLRMSTTAHDSGAVRVWDLQKRESIALQGHDHTPLMAWHPGSQRLLTAGRHRAWVWQLDGTKRPLKLPNADGVPDTIRWSPDGTRILTVSRDGRVDIVSADAGIPPVSIAQEELPREASWSPDGTRILVGYESSARIWNVTDKSDPITLRGAPMRSWLSPPEASWNRDGSQVLTATTESVWIWSCESNSRPVELRPSEAPVQAAAWSPDGTRVLTVSGDQVTRIRLWRTDGTKEKTFGTGSYWDAVWSPDGSQLLSRSADKTARIWELSGGLPRVFEDLETASWSPSGGHLLTQSADNVSHLWTTGDFDRTQIPTQASLHWSPDGSKLAALWKGSVLVWRPDGGSASDEARGVEFAPRSRETTRRTPGKLLQPVCASWSPDGSKVLTASPLDPVLVWEPGSADPPIRLATNGPLIESANWSPDGEYIAVANVDATRIWKATGGSPPVTRWNSAQPLISTWLRPQSKATWSPDGSRILLNGRGPLRVFDKHGASIVVQSRCETATWSPDGSRILVTTSKRAERQGAVIWHLQSPLAAVAEWEGPVSAVWSPDGSRVATFSTEHVLAVRDIAAATSTALAGLGDVHSIRWSADGTRLLTATTERVARVWTVDSIEPEVLIRGHPGKVEIAEWRPRHNGALTACDDTIRVWNLASLTAPVDEWCLHAAVESATWSPDGLRVLATSGRNAYVCTVGHSADPVTLRGHESAVVSAAWNHDGSQALTIGEDATVRLWSLREPHKDIVLKHCGVVEAAAWSPDGSQVLTVDSRALQVWNTDGSGSPTQIVGFDWPYLDGYSNPRRTLPARAEWSPDSSKLLTFSNTSTPRIWQRAGIDQGIALRGHSGRVHDAAWSPDSTQILTVSEDDTVRLWNQDGSGGEVVRKGDVGRTVAWAPGGLHFLTHSRTATITRVDGLAKPVQLDLQETKRITAAWSPDGTQIATAPARDGGAFRIWSVDQSNQSLLLTRSIGRANSLRWNPQGTRVLAAAAQDAQVWTADGSDEPLIFAHCRRHEQEMGIEAKEPLLFAEWSPDGSRILTADLNGKIHVWTVSWPHLRQGLWHETSAYLRAHERVQHLGEDPATAALREAEDRAWILEKAAAERARRPLPAPPR